MRRVVWLVGLCACGRMDFATWDATRTGFAYRKQLAIAPASVVAGQDLAGFPVLVTIDDPDLQLASDGGKLATGVDLAFVAADGVTPLAFEVDHLTAGSLVAWVGLPLLSGSQGATFYLEFGDPAVTSSQEDRAGVWAGGFVGAWHFSETAYFGVAGECVDATGANPGAAAGAVTSTTAGFVGRAASFAGNCANITIPASSALEPSSITVSAWVQPTDVGTGTDRIDTIVAQDYWRAQGTGSQGYYLELYRTVTQPTPDIYVANGPTWTMATSVSNATNGQWTHIAGTYDASSGVAQIYMNGAMSGTASMTGAIQYLSKPVQIGCSPASGWWLGAIDEVRIANVPRSGPWIATEYANQHDPASFVRVGATEPVP